ncbi:MAG: transporter permease, partial [Campylobacterota bacterium]|nr:transporter permease [Campylobacterota bacterium]
IKTITGISESAAIAFQNIQIQKSIAHKPVRVFTVGYEIGKMGKPKRLINGREILLDHFEIVVDEKIGLKLNEVIALGGDNYKVVGITRGAVSSGGDPIVYMSLKDAQKLQFLYNNEQIRNDRARGFGGQNAQQVNAIVAKVTNGANVDEIAISIKRWKHYGVYTDEKEREILQKNLIERSSKQIGLFTAILVVVSSVIISLIIYTMTLGKIKEISILKLIGISNFQIVKMIMQESLMLGFLAFVAGNIFSHMISGKFPKRVVLESSDAMMLLGVVLIVSILGSLSGVYSALKANPTAAIGG